MLVVSVTDINDIGKVRKPFGTELRLDRIKPHPADIACIISSCRKPVVATYRTEGEETVADGLLLAETLLAESVAAGADYIDMEASLPEETAVRLASCCRKHGTGIILSMHLFDRTAGTDDLLTMRKLALRYGADIIKIVSYAADSLTAAQVLSMYGSEPFTSQDTGNNGPGLAAFCMGEAGKFTRTASLSMGAPVMFFAVDGQGSAPGQIRQDEFMKMTDPASYPHSAASALVPPAHFKVPASKSMAQRAIVLAAFSDRQTIIEGYSPCSDSENAIAAMEKAGATVTRDHGRLTVNPAEGFKGRMDCNGKYSKGNPGHAVMNAGESGFLARTFMALASVRQGTTTVTGTGTLCRRSFREEIEDLRRNGITVHADNGDRLPVTVEGEHGRTADMVLEGKGSSQFISGMLMASFLSGGKFRVRTESTASSMYVSLTRKCIDIFRNSDMIEIEGDWSAAASLAAYSIASRRTVEIANLDTESLQPDRMIAGILEDCGAGTSFTEGSLRIVPPPEPAPFSADASQAPDLFPALAAIAAFCRGTSIIRGCGRLANKESDRLACLISEFSRLGIGIYASGDCLMIEGGPDRNRIITSPFTEKCSDGTYSILCSSHSDHRIAMALICAAAGLDADMTVRLDNVSCVNKSYPDFPLLQR